MEALLPLTFLAYALGVFIGLVTLVALFLLWWAAKIIFFRNAPPIVWTGGQDGMAATALEGTAPEVVTRQESIRAPLESSRQRNAACTALGAILPVTDNL